MYENLKGKRGLNLITLVITVAVALILLSVTIVSVSNSVSNATVTAFAEDLSKIQDAVKVYNLQNDAFPTPDSESEALSQGNIIGNVPDQLQTKFTEELNLNSDYNADSALGAFYKIDLSKLDVEKSVRGLKSGGDTSDIYVVSAKTMNVYYLAGVKSKNEVYFSLSSKILAFTTNVKVNNNSGAGSTDVQTVGSITVKKMKKTWSDKMGLTVSTYMDTGETLYIQVPGSTKRAITTTGGNNVFSFDSLNDLKAKAPTIANTDIDLLRSKSGTDKFIQIFKEKNGSQIDIVKVDLSNYDDVAPTYSNVVFNELDSNNTITFNAADVASGIKEIRYDYIGKYNDKGEIERYYIGVDSLEVAYLRARGKKIKALDDGSVTIVLPKEMEGIQVLVLDNAGNWANFTQNTASSIYIGTKLKSMSSTGLSFSLAFNSPNGISSYTTDISSDGQNYINQVTKTVNTNDTVYNIDIEDYVESQTLDEDAYIRVRATDNNSYVSSRKTVTRVVKFNAKDISDETDQFTEVPIPNGFVASEATGEREKSSGLVIYQGTTPVTDDNVDEARTTRNQFVWVPVRNISNFVRKAGYFDNALQTAWNTTDYTEPFSGADSVESSEYNAMYQSVKKYGGFYIGRYEASKSADNLVQCIKNVEPWRRIGWGIDMANVSEGAVFESRRLFPVANATESKDPVSTLVYGTQWDATINWIAQDYSNIEKDSSKYGYYSVTTADDIINTGSNAAYSLKNIYDMAGNIEEWTMEASSTDKRVHRGGYSEVSGEYQPISNRREHIPNYSRNFVGFRVALYLR